MIAASLENDVYPTPGNRTIVDIHAREPSDESRKTRHRAFCGGHEVPGFLAKHAQRTVERTMLVHIGGATSGLQDWIASPGLRSSTAASQR